MSYMIDNEREHCISVQSLEALHEYYSETSLAIVAVLGLAGYSTTNSALLPSGKLACNSSNML